MAEDLWAAAMQINGGGSGANSATSLSPSATVAGPAPAAPAAEGCGPAQEGGAPSQGGVAPPLIPGREEEAKIPVLGPAPLCGGMVATSAAPAMVRLRQLPFPEHLSQYLLLHLRRSPVMAGCWLCRAGWFRSSASLSPSLLHPQSPQQLNPTTRQRHNLVVGATHRAQRRRTLRQRRRQPPLARHAWIISIGSRSERASR